MCHCNDKVLLTVRTIVAQHILPSCISSGAHTLLYISSKPTVAELDEFIVQSITDQWEQVMFHFGVESLVINILEGDNPGQSQEASQRVLSSWLNAKPGMGEAERSWHSVLQAPETSGLESPEKGSHRQLGDKLKTEHFGESSEGPDSEPTFAGVCAAGLSRDSIIVTDMHFCGFVNCILVHIVAPLGLYTSVTCSKWVEGGPTYSVHEICDGFV